MHNLKKLKRIKKVTTLCNLIKGKWQAEDDANVILLFGGYKMYETYGKDASAVYNFILSYSCDILKAISVSVEPLLDKALGALTRLDRLYVDADVKRKRGIIGSIFHEKLVFDGFNYRTARLNEAVELIYSMGKVLAKIKMDKPSYFSICPLGAQEWIRTIT